MIYTWDFGDGSEIKDGAIVKHTYTKGGVYTATVTVDDKKGTHCSVDSASVNVKVNTPPLANAGENLVCCIDKTSVFNASSSSDPDGDKLSYTWDFGDGSTAEGAETTHVYTKSGTYTVTLTVNDNQGTACSISKSSFVAHVSESPVAVIKVR